MTTEELLAATANPETTVKDAVKDGAGEQPATKPLSKHKSFTLTPSQLIEKGIAPVRHEFVLTNTTKVLQEAVTGSAKGELVEKLSKKKQRKARQEARKTNLCFNHQRGTCQHGDKCRYSHDTTAYIATKDPDLPGKCPHHAQPSCPHGIGCRWASTHKDSAAGKAEASKQQDAASFYAIAPPLGARYTGDGSLPTHTVELPAPETIQREANWLPVPVCQELRNCTYPFDTAHSVLDKLGVQYKFYGKGKKAAQHNQKHSGQKAAQQSGKQTDGQTAAEQETAQQAKRARVDGAEQGQAVHDGAAEQSGITANGQVAAQQGETAEEGAKERAAVDAEYTAMEVDAAEQRLVGEAEKRTADQPNGAAIEAATEAANGPVDGSALVAVSGAISARADGAVSGAVSVLEKGPVERKAEQVLLYDVIRERRATYTEERMSGREKLAKKEKFQRDIRGKSYLAPLTTVGNLPFRRLCKGLGAGITCGEMALGTNLLQGQRSEWALLKKHRSEDFFGVQVCGGFADTMARCAQLLNDVCELDFVDLNCGCPIDCICDKGAGSSLMTRPERFKQVVTSMSTLLDCPFTVKIRKGYYDDRPLAHSLVQQVGSWGAAAVTVHGRTRQQRYTKLADWDYIQQCSGVCKDIPLIGNGDCFTHHDFEQRLQQGVATVLIARGALIKPWVFTEIEEKRDWDISASERFDIVKQYCAYGLEHWGADKQGVEATRKFLLEWLSYTCRYVPIGLLEVGPAQMHWRAPAFKGRNDLEALLGSDSPQDWVRISEMLLGPAPPGFVFAPKHKSNAYATTEDDVAKAFGEE